MSTIASVKLSLLFLLFLHEKGVKGFVDMTCSSTDTAFGQPSICTCTTDSVTGVAWQKDGTNLLLCLTAGVCDTTLIDYDNGYSTSGVNKVFILTVKSFGYSSCAVFTCKDQDTTDTDSEILTLHEFNRGTPSITSEPGGGKNGTIEITTACLFKMSDIVVYWYAVDGGSMERITPEKSFMTSNACSDLSKVCSGEKAVTLNIGFTHTEKIGKCVHIKVEVYHLADPSSKIEWTTSGYYCIEAE